MIEPLDFDKEAETFKGVMTNIVTQHGTFSPMMLMESVDGMRWLAACRPIFNEQDKNNAFQEIFSLLGITGAVQAIFVCDAWVSTQPKRKDGSFMRPSLDPNRVDVLTVIHLRCNGENTFKSFPYVRDENTNQLFWIEADFMKRDTPAALTEGVIPTMAMTFFGKTAPISLRTAKRVLLARGHRIVAVRPSGWMAEREIWDPMDDNPATWIYEALENRV